MMDRTSIFLLAILMLFTQLAGGQDKVSLQVKTFDQNLNPLPNIQIGFNELDFFQVGSKGTAIVEINQSEIPIKAIRVRNEGLEAASWNLSRGTIEIIVRPLSYKVMHVSVRFADGTPLANYPVTFRGTKTISVTSDQSGKFDLPVAVHEDIRSADEFETGSMIISNISVNDDQVVLVVERQRPAQSPPQTTSHPKAEAPPFDVARLDSIKSLAEFYAVFRNISMSSLNEDVRLLVDEKFRQLVAQRQDSIQARQRKYITDISDTSLVLEDIRNLLKQATDERNTLRTNREEFEDKIVVISSKLKRGVLNLSDTERTSLLRDIDLLEQLLTENESQFYENHNDYREIINTLREKYLDMEELQNRLSEAERLREAESREFRQRLVGIGAVVVAFGFLIILLITFATRLRRRTKSLQAANERIEQINENLEAIVAKRTHLLEEANKELDTFLYRASHDLKTPVHSMMGLSQIVDHIDRGEMVQHVRLVTERMNHMLEKLVDISEISQEVRNISYVNIPATIKSVCERYTPKTNKRVEFDIDCPDSLQMATSHSLLEVIIANLVENAIFFGALKRSNDSVRVKIRARVQNNNLELSIQDNGVGIPKVLQPRIFSMFFTGNEASKGSGLGLYAVKKCVMALHGTITFETEEGTFTRFHVVIPSSVLT
jgi:signal transduction histidine kinase